MFRKMEYRLHRILLICFSYWNFSFAGALGIYWSYRTHKAKRAAYALETEQTRLEIKRLRAQAEEGG